MFSRILYATDGSPQSERARGVAVELAKLCHSEVIIVHAYAYVPELLGTPNYEALLDGRVSAGNRVMDAAVKPFEEAGLTFKRELLEGSPAESILSVAETRDCDLIVLGTRGMSDLEGLLLGSTSHRVIQNAKCPVLTIP